MSSFGSKDLKRKKSSGGVGSAASSEDEQEAEKDRMETKRHREKKRRFEITHAVENLSKMIMKIEPEILQSKHGGMNDNLRGISGIGSRLGGGAHYGNNCASASFHRSLNRTDVITCACEVMDRLHQENERLRQELKALGNDTREDGQRLFPNSPISMINGTGGTITATTTGVTAAATNSGLMNHLPHGGTGRMTGTASNNIGSNTESKLHNRSLLANSLGLSHPTGTNSHQNSKQHQQQQQHQQQHQHHQATPDAISPQMLQNQYNILQQLIQLQQLQQQYPLAMQQLANSTCSLGIPPGLFPTNTLFGGGGTTNNFSAALNAGSLSSLNPVSSMSLQQLLLSRSLQQQQQQQQGSNHDEIANAPGGNMMMHNFGNIGHESKGNGRIGGEGDSFT